MAFSPKTLRTPAGETGRPTVLSDFVERKVETMSIYQSGSMRIVLVPERSSLVQLETTRSHLSVRVVQ